MVNYKVLLISLAVVVLALLILPLRMIRWGTVGIRPQDAITVTGEAKKDVQNQVATFSAGVSAVNDNKDTAVKEVNDAVNSIIESVKNFGIAEGDIKTQNLSIYQGEEPYYSGGTQKYKLGQWHANNTVEIKLRDVAKANELADLLSKSGANNVYGPNFSLDDTTDSDSELLKQAIENARQKAQSLAEASNRKLGKIISVTEGYSSPIMPYAYEKIGMGGGASVPTEPGSQTVSKALTVTFEMN